MLPTLTSQNAASMLYLPSSFTGGPRYIKIHYDNAMALVTPRLGRKTREPVPTAVVAVTQAQPAVLQIKLIELLRHLLCK
ncbi:hypothetical protein J6590_057038 [Homalodisca vitripennis]|nr:hypothetical protein J6590_057038 [Homalodisca vitripennis]